MIENPIVTIVTPSYNQGDFIEETIKSVINQSYKNIQYIVVDGGSSDNTMEIINKYKSNIDIIIHERDSGQADAINKGFKLAKGELVGWINSDDILYKDCVGKIVDLYKKKPNGSIYYHSYNDFININGDIIKTYQHIIPNYLYLIKENYNVIQQGSFYPRKKVEEVGYLNTSNYYCMDLELWLKLSKCGEIIFSDDKSYSAFRMYRGTKTDTGQHKFLKNIYVVLKRHGAKYYYRTIWHYIFIYWLKTRIKYYLLKVQDKVTINISH